MKNKNVVMIKNSVLCLLLCLKNIAFGQDTLYANKGSIWEDFGVIALPQRQNIKDEHIKKVLSYQYERKNGIRKKLIKL